MNALKRLIDELCDELERFVPHMRQRHIKTVELSAGVLMARVEALRSLLRIDPEWANPTTTVRLRDGIEEVLESVRERCRRSDPLGATGSELAGTILERGDVVLRLIRSGDMGSPRATSQRR